MKPNFALSLSYEGIRLLHRTVTGAGTGTGSVWTLVGEVPIDAPDLASHLAMLRKTGLALDPQGLRTKLLIPNDQIKYLALDTTRAGDEDVRAALDGATPYAVADLTFDFVRGGGRTYIAAVARETLAEAEAFAAEHRFGPVSFAGVPVPFTFLGEPFFGPTSIADRLLGAGQRVERDDVAVAYQSKGRQADKPVIAAIAPMPVLPQAPMQIPAPLVSTEVEPVAAAPGVALPDAPVPDAPVLREPVPDAESTDTLLPGSVRVPLAEPAGDTRPRANLPPPDPTALAFGPQPPTFFVSATATTLALPNLPGQSFEAAPFIDVPADLEPELAEGPPAGTTGISADIVPPETSLPVDVDRPAHLPADAAAAESTVVKAPLVPEPVFASRGRTLRADSADVPAMRQPLPAPPGSRTPGSEGGSEPIFSRRTEPPVSKPVAASTVLQTPLVVASDEPAPTFRSRAEATAALPTLPSLTGAVRQVPDPAAPRPFNAKLPTAASAPAVTGQSGTARPAEAVAATVIPFRPTSDVAETPPATPVSIKTVTLTPAKPPLNTLAGALNGSALPSGKQGSFASKHGGAFQAAPQTGPEPALDRVGSNTRGTPGPIRAKTQAGLAASHVPGRGRPRYLGLILTLILLAALAAVAFWASFLTPNGLAGLFGRPTPTEVASAPAEPSPLSVSDLTDAAAGLPADGTALTADAPAIVPGADTGPDVAALPELITPEIAADAVAEIPPEIAVADPAPSAAAAEPGTVVSPAEADRIYAATGVWLRAPRLPLTPTTDPVGNLTQAAVDNGVVAVTRPEMPSLTGAAPDQALLTPVDPPAPGTVFQRDARGFVLATAEGTLTPNGILVYAGTPVVIPPNRPGSAQPVTAAQTAPRIIAASAPPLAPRPATISAEPAPDPLATTAATAGAVGLNSLGSLVRPLPRPGSLTPSPASVLADPLADAPVLAAFSGPAPQTRPVGLTPETVALPDPTTPNPAVDDTVAAILAAIPPDPITSNSPLAVATARMPETRPQNFADVVASAQQRSATVAPQNPSLAVIDPPPEAPAVEPPAEQPAAQPELLPESAIADEIVAPSGPIPGGVAANATLAEAIDLREVNLIGVFGRPNDRRALVRLANGRYVRVGVGDSLDGGQVAAIGDNALNYVKRGQTITIAIPNG